MRKILPVLLLALVGCVSETDPWPGVYRGTAFSDSRDCETGEASSTGPEPGAITLVRNESGELIWNSMCAFPVIELDGTAARLASIECDATLRDGTPVHVGVVNGRLDLDGDELALQAALDISTPLGCITSVVDFVGYRE